MDTILNQLLEEYNSEFFQGNIEKPSITAREIITPFNITFDKRYLNVSIIRQDLNSVLMKIYRKISSMLSRKTWLRDNIIKVECSEHHQEIVSKKITCFFNTMLTCKCGEKELRYLKKNFYCNACGAIISAVLKFNKL